MGYSRAGHRATKQLCDCSAGVLPQQRDPPGVVANSSGAAPRAGALCADANLATPQPGGGGSKPWPLWHGHHHEPLRTARQGAVSDVGPVHWRRVSTSTYLCTYTSWLVQRIPTRSELPTPKLASMPHSQGCCSRASLVAESCKVCFRCRQRKGRRVLGGAGAIPNTGRRPGAQRQQC